MKKTLERSSGKWKKLAVSTETLCGVLDCGRATAVKIGTDAGARIQIGRRVLYDLDAVERYLNAISGE